MFQKLRKKKFIVIAIILAVIAGVVFFGNGEENDGSIEVQTAKVANEKVVQTVNATGRIQPKTQVKISADVSAKIMRLGVKEGQWVEKGQFLLELDRESYLAAVESQEANLRSTRASAKLAEANMLKAEKDYKRIQQLFQQSLESQATMDAAHATYEVEKARYQSALDNIQQIVGTLKQTRDNLAKTTIFAPISGTISQLNKEVGEIALGSQFQEDVIMVLSNLAGMESQVNVDENDIVSVEIGDTASIEVDALPEYTFTGVVTEIANTASVTGEGTSEQKTEFAVKIAVISGDEASGLKLANTEVRKSNGLEKLRPGMTASSDIVTESRKATLAVPLQSVAVRTVDQLQADSGDEESDDNPNSYTPDRDGFVEVVFIIEDGVAKARQVQTGIQSETHIEVLSGLSENDEIVIGNYRAISQDLQNGSKVKVANKQETLAAAH